MDLSIIIPVYNIEKYIRDCINSVILLDSDILYEIIIINDGSEDNSISIIEEFRKYDNVRIFHQDNQGLSFTRNKGLQNATGDYIFFYDGDDTVNFEELIKLLNEAKYHKLDIAFGNYLLMYENNSFEKPKKTFTQEKIGVSLSIFNNYYIDKISSVVWRAIYKRELLLTNKLFFSEKLYFEDVEWMPMAILSASKIGCFPIDFYFYRIRMGSIMNSPYSEKKAFDALYIANKLEIYSHKINDPKATRKIQKVILHMLYQPISKYNKKWSKDMDKLFSEIFSKMPVLSTQYIKVWGAHLLHKSVKKI
jgi:glycosyltransferase involved in cell wall biosynthesis